MARMTQRNGLTENLQRLLGARAHQVLWELRRGVRRLTRYMGYLGWASLFFLVLALLIWLLNRHQQVQVNELQTRQSEHRTGQVQGTLAAKSIKNIDIKNDLKILEDLKSFEDFLMLHEDIPVVVQDLLRMAEDQKLTVQKGEYRVQRDVTGGFMRYRMSLPIKGTASTVHRYIEAALSAQKTLALESVQFKRDRIESIDIE
ncbi:MAG: hypothetical protein RI918_2263, partial [Pseudomonadota bacterium]